MKKRYLFGIFILVFLIGFLTFFNTKKVNIDKVLKSEVYEKLPKEAKKYVKEVYEKSGEVLLTEENKKEKEPYLNPEYLRYLSLSQEEQEEYEIIPEKTIVDYVYNVKASNDLPRSFDLRNVDVDGDGIADRNYITPLKDQKTLPNCSIFATIEHAESHAMVMNDETYESGKNQEFSTRQYDYAASRDGIKNYVNLYGSHYLATGTTPSSMSYALASGISLFPASWKYESSLTDDKLEYLEVFDDRNSLYEVDSTINMPSFDFKKNDITSVNGKAVFDNYINTIKGFIKEYGGAVISTYAPTNACSAINYYDTDHYIMDFNTTCGRPSETGHAMQVIGWDDDYRYKYCDSKWHYRYGDNCENVVEGKGAWILRNSWGDTREFYNYTYITYQSFYYTLNFITQMTSKDNRDWNYVINEAKNELVADKIDTTTSILNITSPFDIHAKLIKIKLNNEIIDNEYKIYLDTNGNGNYTLLESDIVSYPGFFTIDYRKRNTTLRINRK